MTEELKNAGYTILERFPVGEQGFALGYSETAPATYVTWQYRTADPSHFFWGHYVSTKEAAYEDYRNRINAEVDYLSEQSHKPPLLPALCLTVEPSSGDLINIRRGEHGFYRSDWNRPGEPEHNRKTANVMNKRWGVTRAQEEAMLAGSLFGWDCPAATPRSYDENGQPKRVKKRDEMER